MPRVRFIVLGLALAAAALAFSLPRLRPIVFHGTDLGPDAPVRGFTLEAADRGPVSLSDFRGRVVLLFFGYTSCPDVCPTTMAKLRSVVERLGDRRSDVQVVLVTVDPEIDTPRRLREYVQGFDLGFVGLGGERAELAAVARSFGAWAGAAEAAEPAARTEPADHADHADAGADGAGGTDQAAATSAPAGPPGGARIIPHTSHVFGIDRDGRFRVLWGPELRADAIAEDVRRLLRL